LSFDPSCIGGSLSDESPPLSPLTAATLSIQLEGIIAQLESPIETLVKDCKGIRSALEPIVDGLPSDLRRALQPAAYLEFLRTEVLTAAAHLAARENQAALKEQITNECSAANQLKAKMDDSSTKDRLEKALEDLNEKKTELTKEIKRLQEELSKVDTAIENTKTALDEDALAKQELAFELKANLANLRSLQKNLVTGPEDADRKVIKSADDIRLKALSAAQQYRQKLSSSS
jgi:chromosome segregation ATPase